MTQSEPQVRAKPNVIGRLLRSFWVNLVFVMLGFLFGGLFKDWGVAFHPVGRLYLSFLSMCIIPIVLTAITSGLGEMLREGTMNRYLKRIVAVYLAAVLLGASLGVFAGWVGKPGEALDTDARKALGKMMLKMNPSNVREETQQSGISGLLNEAVPANVVKAMAEDKILGIVLVSILMGVALGLSRSDESRRVLEFMKGTLEMFKRILGWVLYALPFALFSLSAALVSTTGWSMLAALFRVLLVIYACCVTMCLLYAFVIHLVTRHSFFKILTALQDALALAFFSNSLVAMPLAMQKLESGLKLPGAAVRLVLPLGVVMNRHIYPLVFALMAVLTAQIYGHALTIGEVVRVVLSSALVGMAAVGNVAIVAPFVHEVIQPLGLPAGIAIIILVQSTAVVNPVVKMTQLFGSCATTSMICSRPLKRDLSDPHSHL